MKRKYARHSDTNSEKYECTKRKCKWQGTYEEKAEKKIEEGYYEKTCPKCGNNEFYNLINN